METQMESTKKIKSISKKEKVEYKFHAKSGSPFPVEMVNLIGKTLLKIEKENNGVLTAPLLVEHAKNKSSPLHKLFDWNKEIASRKWLEQQARMIINHVEIEIVVVKSKEINYLPQFINVSFPSKDDIEVSERGYINSEKVLGTPELRGQALNYALNQLIHWADRYKIYREFDEIVFAINVVEKKLMNK